LIETIAAKTHLIRNMGGVMAQELDDSADLLQRAVGGDPQAVQDLFARHRDRLKRMVHLRLSRRLQGRVDDSDVLQEAFLNISTHLHEYAADPNLPFYLWLRHITGLKLAEIHRRHLGTQLRDADREVTLHRGGLPEADSISLAAHLLGQLTTPSQAAIKAETRMIVQEALNNMDPTDREVLALKHFEQLSTSEIAEVLGMSKAGAGSRYLRAIKRLKEILSHIPGLIEQ
jgi:RNA polymerase sigma-70 factor, ECF subfamily